MKKQEVEMQILGYKFLALDKEEKSVVVAMNQVDHGYQGFVLRQDNTGYELNPFFVASSFIEIHDERYDFTNNLNEAFEYITTQP